MSLDTYKINFVGCVRAPQSFIVFFDLFLLYYHLNGMDKDFASGGDSMVRGHHVYQEVWTPTTGEYLVCAREVENLQDHYTVAVLKHNEIIGNLPRTISTISSLFIRRRGSIQCEVIDHRCYSRDLPQGGMEVPCKLHFCADGSELKKVKAFFSKLKLLLWRVAPKQKPMAKY